MRKRTPVRALTEGAVLVALAMVLGYIKLWRMPWGGSVTLVMLPIILYGVRWGLGQGLLAGLFRGKKGGVFLGTVTGCLGRFLSLFVTGATLWAEYMPDEFFGMTMTSPWIYSLLYNLAYILPSMVVILVVFAALWKPAGKYLRGADLG